MVYCCFVMSFTPNEGPEEDAYPTENRLKVWGSGKIPCHGRYIRDICIYNVGDLPTLAQATQLFANKFHAKLYPLSYDCLEELHYNRTRQDLTGERTTDVAYYRAQPYVRYASHNTSRVYV